MAVTPHSRNKAFVVTLTSVFFVTCALAAPQVDNLEREPLEAKQHQSERDDIVTRSCNSETSLNNTYFIPDSSFSLGTCELTVNKMSSNICQIRLDFQTFHLDQPDIDGVCQLSSFKVINYGPSIDEICGDNGGQHMYVDVNTDVQAIKLHIDRSVGSSLGNWAIKVSQIGCHSLYRAPPGCLQYYTESSGSVSSFNYASVQGTLLDSRQLADQQYTVCIKGSSGYCDIVWTRNKGSTNSFTMSGAPDALPPTIELGDPDLCNKDDDCSTDYVIIPEGVTDLGEQVDRLCGLGFPNTVTSSSSPFELLVKTNGDENPESNNLGFMLDYRLDGC